MDSHPPSKSGLPLKEPIKERLARFAALIHEWNQRINLTGFRSLAEIEQILIGEALQALPHLNISGKAVLDFGSGAGIPGLVWSICEPSARITSLEIRQKKIAFQKEVVRELRIPAEIIRGLFPDAVTGRKFDVIASRAIRFSSLLWEDARQLLVPGGIIARFAAVHQVEKGWESIPISDRSALLLAK